MNEKAFEVAELISGYLQCNLTPEKEQQLFVLLKGDKEMRKLLEAYIDPVFINQRLDKIKSIDVDQAWLKVDSRFKKDKRLINRRQNLLKYAAIFLVIIGMSAVYLFTLKQSDPRIIPDISKKYKNDLLPATQTAILILSDGQKVTLDKNKQSITDENGIQISTENGEIVYNGSQSSSDLTKYNTLIVPKAGTYAITLPDGSKVILNAMSKLKFPVVFSGAERRVDLTGEGYFEVAKDLKRPFKVKLEESEVEVLGTHFNISSYTKTSKITLLEGSVKVSNGNEREILIPGKEALANKGKIKISKGDTEKAIAWCKGDFYFLNDELLIVLTEISRWYDLHLIYKKDLTPMHISGHISRQAKLSEVVDMLKDVTNLDISIEDKKLIIN